MVLLIVGGAVISTIGVVSVVVFMYQKRRQAANNKQVQVIVKERHETIMGYKPRERVALEWFIP